jgi:hypothetical protein
MTPPDGATVIEFDPHVIWALLSLFLALVVTFLVIAAEADNTKGGR